MKGKLLKKSLGLYTSPELPQIIAYSTRSYNTNIGEGKHCKDVFNAARTDFNRLHLAGHEIEIEFLDYISSTYA